MLGEEKDLFKLDLGVPDEESDLRRVFVWVGADCLAGEPCSNKQQNSTSPKVLLYYTDFIQAKKGLGRGSKHKI